MTHFLDLQFCKKDRDYVTTLMNNLIYEKYLITTKINTSFTELDNITPLERKALIKHISDTIQKEKEQRNKLLGNVKEL